MDILPRERRIEALLDQRFEWTARQRDVLDLIARGKTNQEVADTLGISLDGAKWHMREILSKLGVDSREEAAEYWRRRNGWSQRARRLAPLLWPPGRWLLTGAAGAGLLIAAAGLWAATSRNDDSGSPPLASSPQPGAPTVPPSSVQVPGPGPDVSLATGRGTTSGVFLLDWAGLGAPGQLRPLDATTGLDQPGFLPADMGHATRFYPSPDGTRIALLRHPSQEQGSELFLLDSRAWSIKSISTLRNWWHPTWSPDGRYLYRLGAAPSDRKFQRLDVATGAIEDIGQLQDWWPMASEFSPDGSRIYVLGMNSSDPRANVLKGDPFLAVLDPTDGREVGRVPLPGLSIGQVHESDGGQTWYAQYTAAMALSPDGRRVYIPDPASESLRVVNTTSLTVEVTLALAPGKPAWKRALGGIRGWFVDTAHAKGGPTFRVQAEVSDDGRFVYLASARDVGCRGPGECEEGRPVGLRVIDTERLQVVHREAGVSTFSLSPDGSTLVAWAGGWWGPELTAGDYYVRHGDGVKVVDARDPRLLAHFAAGEAVQEAVVSNGGSVFVAAPGPGLEEAMQNQGACSQTCYTLRVFDTGTGEMTGERTITSGIFMLLTFPR